MQGDAYLKIRTISMWARRLLIAILAAIVAGCFYLMARLATDLPGLTADLKMWLGGAAYPMTFSIRAILALLVLACINLGLVFKAWLAVWQLFGLLQKGRVFSRLTGERLRTAGAMALAGAASAIISRTLSLLVVTYDNPSGEKILLISFGSSEAVLLLVAALLYAMGHVITLASDIERENRSFV